MSVIELGQSIPVLTSHAVSVSLPLWSDNVAYEEGQESVLSKMVIGYPRFFINKLITAFAEDIVKKHGSPNELAMLFPSSRAARRCVNFMLSRDASMEPERLRIVDLVLDASKEAPELLTKISPCISAVIYPSGLFPFAKQYWQHSGDGVSSRRAEFCHAMFLDGLLVDQETLRGASDMYPRLSKGPRRYQRGSVDKTSPKSRSIGSPTSETQQLSVTNGISETNESSQFVEERFGRNLDVSFVDSAKSAIRRRIAGSLLEEVELESAPSEKIKSDTRGVTGLSEDDVLLYPCGMNSIFHTHRMMLEARGPLKSISFGFPYVDTLKILEKFGPGCLFYGNGSSEDLDDLENRLKTGERYLALFCEFPTNPMLKCPDLKRIRKLANTYDFGVVIDETIGNFINVHVLPEADVVVSSLTKIFSGESNVMGGSSIFNPQGKYYQLLKKTAEVEYEDNYWAEDIIFMERNSRHFVSRIGRINDNAEAICEVLRSHPLVKTVYYPKFNPTRCFYDACRTANGGYGGLLSVTFQTTAQAIAFYDRIETAKGPSLGTNFTLASPYVVLAHFLELDWAAQFGVPGDLVRMSVGLEDEEDLKNRVAIALKAAEAVEVSC